jgi:hypothetical protein
MYKLLRVSILVFILFFLLLNCKSTKQTVIENEQVIYFSSDNLDCCDDFEQQAIKLDRKKEIVILVHGCKASSGQFSTLKQVFEMRGQQAICFNYDYRDSIEECSGQLLTAVNLLSDLVNPPQITIIGHSQGALVARRALITERKDGLVLSEKAPPIRFVTISGPFNGIEASSHCGNTPLHIASGGITVLICQAIAGSTWREINPNSNMINNPGILLEKVYQHLKINTDEVGTCRSYTQEGNCEESDYVFSLDEQYKEVIDNDARVINIDLKAGHAQVVGKPGSPPFDLIHILEESKILNEQTYLSLAEEKRLFSQLY